MAEFTDDWMVEQVEYLLSVGPSRYLFRRLVDEGSGLDPEEERFRIDGDDLAGMCFAISQIAEHFNVDWRRNDTHRTD